MNLSLLITMATIVVAMLIKISSGLEKDFLRNWPMADTGICLMLCMKL